MLKLIALLVCVASLQASTIDFGTAVGGPEGNDYNGTNVVTAVSPAWHAAIGDSLWESIQSDTTSPQVPNGTLVDFWFNFTLPQDATYSGIVSILADDAAAVTLNGTLLFNNLGTPLGAHCSESLPNCVTQLGITTSPYLVGGLNRLDVQVEQEGLGPFGVDVFGKASSTAPEPGSVFMAGGALLLGIGLIRRRK